MISRSRTGGGQKEGGREARTRTETPPVGRPDVLFWQPQQSERRGGPLRLWLVRPPCLAHSLPLPHSLLPAHSSFHNITPLTRYQNTSAATVAARLASPPGRQPSPRTTETNAARSGPKRGRREKCPRSNQCTGANRPHRRWGCPSKKRVQHAEPSSAWPVGGTRYRVFRCASLSSLMHGGRAPHRAPTD